MRQSHSEIGEERFIFSPHHKIEEKLDRGIRTIFSVFRAHEFAISIKAGIPITGAFILGLPGMIKRPLVESRILNFHPSAPAAIRVGKVGRIVGIQLPLPGDASAIASILHEMTKGPLFRIEYSKVEPVPLVVFSRHDLHTRRRAKRLGICVGKPNSLLRQLVESGRLIRLRAVATQAIDREIISHDEKNVRTIVRNSHQGKARD